jgi:DegV family protein with EDD domain
MKLKIIYPDKEYDDRLEISPEEVYARFPEQIPTTSMATRESAIKLFNTLSDKGYKRVIAIILSNGLSGTYSMLESLSKEYSDMDIRVINSNSLSLGLGWIVLEAANLLKEGKMEFEDVVERLKRLPEKIKVFYSIPTLEYLKRGGRIGLVAAVLGSIVDLKPIISINKEGKYYSHAKVRSRKKSLGKIVEIVEELTKDKNINLAVMHGDAEKEALDIKRYFENKPNIKQIFFGQISPTLVVHTGPGLVGLCYQLLD